MKILGKIILGQRKNDVLKRKKNASLSKFLTLNDLVRKCMLALIEKFKDISYIVQVLTVSLVCFFSFFQYSGYYIP